MLPFLTTPTPAVRDEGPECRPQGLAALSLRRNLCWTLTGSVIYAACQWGVLVSLAKLGDPEMVGVFGFGLAVSGPVMQFASLQLRTVQATDARSDYQFTDYLALTLVTTLLGLLVIVGIVLVGGFSRETALVVVAVGLGKGFAGIGEAFYGLFQRLEKMDCVAKALSIQGVLSLVALTVSLYLTRDVIWGTAGWAVASGLTWMISTVPTGKAILRAVRRTTGVMAADRTPEPGRPRQKWEPMTLLRLAWLVLPLGLVTLLSSLAIYIPRYFVAYQLGTRDLGILTALASVPLAGSMAVAALCQSVTPRLAKHFAAGAAVAFRRVIIKLVAVGIVFAGAGILVVLVGGRAILTLLYTAEYAQHIDVLEWLMVGAGLTFVSMFLGAGIMAARRFVAQTVLFVGVLGVTAVVSALLIPRHGLVGAALAVVSTGACEIIGGTVVLIGAIRACGGQK